MNRRSKYTVEFTMYEPVEFQGGNTTCLSGTVDRINVKATVKACFQNLHDLALLGKAILVKAMVTKYMTLDSLREGLCFRKAENMEEHLLSAWERMPTEVSFATRDGWVAYRVCPRGTMDYDLETLDMCMLQSVLKGSFMKELRTEPAIDLNVWFYVSPIWDCDNHHVHRLEKELREVEKNRENIQCPGFFDEEDED